jgi:hypothetical protein
MSEMNPPTLAELYTDSLLRRAAEIAPDPDNAAQVYRLARHLATGWIITDDGIVCRRWSDYTAHEKAERREYARELALTAKQQRAAAYAVSA